MNDFNHLEKTVSDFLAYFPRIKNFIKWVYQLLNYLFYKKKYVFKSKYSINPVSDFQNEYFFGYYDKSPESPNGNFIIYQQFKGSTLRKPTLKKPVDIVVKDLRNNEETIIGDSYTYNWQQGTKLQWISNSKFIYNFYDSVNNIYKSKIIDVLTKKEKIINFPIYDCFKENYALSLSFNRLRQLRPDYGYRNIVKKIDFSKTNDDGIFKIDMNLNTSFLLLSLQKVIDLFPVETMNKAKHKINHIMISPNGERFIFIHRWFSSGGKRFDRLIISDIYGGHLKILADEDMVSHCCWNGNNEVIAYLKQRSYGDSFYRINVNNFKIELLSDKLINFHDGHPSVLNNRMIFDSYPDRARMQHLFIYNIKTDEVEEIGEFFESLKYFKETRCDLHPKWNYAGNKIFIDSVHVGKRKLYMINID